jgi:small subunit ribosomal protein S9
VAEETQAEQSQAPESATIPAPDPKKHYFWGVGRRKSAVARVRVRAGEGKIEINKRPLDTYFSEDKDRFDVVAPLKATQTFGKVDVFANVQGGGITGQAGAIMLGVARALKAANKDYDHVLREGGYLTRDDRAVERKKYGRRGARRSFQFSKR